MESNIDSSSAVSPHPSSSTCYPYKRKRFRIDLVPGETTIVSWKKLLSDQGKYEIKEPCAPLQLIQDNLLQIDNSSTKYSDTKVHVEENIIHINEAPKLENHRPKKRTDKEEASKEKDSYDHKLLQNVKSDSHDEKQQHYSFHASVGFSIEKPCDPNIRFECSSVAITVNQCSSTGLSVQDSKSGVRAAYSTANSDNNTKVQSDKRRKEHLTRVQKKDKKNILDQLPDQNNILDQLPDLNIPYPASSPTYNLAKDASDSRQNGTISEKIITKKLQCRNSAKVRCAHGSLLRFEEFSQITSLWRCSWGTAKLKKQYKIKHSSFCDLVLNCKRNPNDVFGAGQRNF